MGNDVQSEKLILLSSFTLLWLSLDMCSVGNKNLSCVTDTLTLHNFAKQNYLQLL